jgi:hypothetical protein
MAGVSDDESPFDLKNPGMSLNYSARQVGKDKPSILDGISTFNADIKPPAATGRDKADRPTI